LRKIAKAMIWHGNEFHGRRAVREQGTKKAAKSSRAAASNPDLVLRTPLLGLVNAVASVLVDSIFIVCFLAAIQRNIQARISAELPVPLNAEAGGVGGCR